MTLSRIEGNWKQFKGNVKQQWGELADDQLAVIAGKREHQAGRVQESHGISREQAKKRLIASEINVTLQKT